MYLSGVDAPEWCSHGDLNPKPPGYEPDALPIELCKHVTIFLFVVYRADQCAIYYPERTYQHLHDKQSLSTLIR